jgi:hypothetical protein
MLDDRLPLLESLACRVRDWVIRYNSARSSAVRRAQNVTGNNLVED